MFAVMYTEAAASETSPTQTHCKTASMSVDGKRLVSEAEWQLLHKEVRWQFSHMQVTLMFAESLTTILELNVV